MELQNGNKNLWLQTICYVCFSFEAVKNCSSYIYIYTQTDRERETCALLGYYAASSGNFSTTFWDNLSDPSSGFKNLWILSWTLRMELIGHSKMLVRNYHYSLLNKPEECSSRLLCEGSPKSLIYIYIYIYIQTHTHTYVYTPIPLLHLYALTPLASLHHFLICTSYFQFNAFLVGCILLY